MATCLGSLRRTLRSLTGLAGALLGIIGVLFVHDAVVAPVLSNSPPAAPALLPEPPPFQTLLISAGLVIVDPVRGYVFLCTDAFLPGFPPIPQGQCTKIGSVGTSTVGFTLIKSGAVNFFLINNTTDHIFQCVTASSQYTGAPDGVCKQTGNIRGM